MDKAPTIPNERAILPDITFVITNDVIGKIQQVIEYVKFLAHF